LHVRRKSEWNEMLGMHETQSKMVSRIRWNDKEMLILNEIVTITKIGLKSH